MQSFLQNLHYSLRMLRKSPGLTLTVLLTLVLGIGANTAIFTVDYATLMAPSPYPLGARNLAMGYLSLIIPEPPTPRNASPFECGGSALLPGCATSGEQLGY